MANVPGATGGSSTSSPVTPSAPIIPKPGFMERFGKYIPFVVNKSRAAAVAGVGMAGAAWGFGSKVAKSVAEKAPSIKYSMMFIIACILAAVNFVYSSNNTLKLSLLIVYLVIFYYSFQNNIDNINKEYGKIIFFSLIYIFAPTLGNLLVSYVPDIGIRNLLVYFLFIFGYLSPLIMLLSVHHEENWFSITLELLLVFFLIVLVLKFMATAGILPEGDQISSDQKEAFTSLFVGTWDTIKSIPTYVKTSINGTAHDINQSWNQIQGNSYEEEIDQSALVSTLGLKLNDISFSNTDGAYYQGDPIDAWTSIEGKSLARVIKVKTSCVVDRKRGLTENITWVPKKPEFYINDIGFEDISCKFPKNKFTTVRSYELEMFADFDFTTSSYLRRYFISEADNNNMRKNNIDPIVYYNIPQTDEEGKYTNGPVELSVVKNNLLQPLADQGDTFLLGIKIATNRKQGFGDGKLVTMTNLHLSLPPGFELARDGSRYDCGNYEFEVYPGADCIADCTRLMKGERCIADCNNYNNYRLKAADSNNISAGVLPKIKEEGKEFVKLPLQIPCYVKTKSSQSILKTSKFVMENFRATADYDFEISVAKPFKIQEKQGYVNAEKLADFCGFKTSYINSSLITKDNVNSLISRSAELINDSKVSFSGSTVCSQLIKAIVVYKNRNGVENNMGYGITGITEEQLDYSYQWPTNLANVETQHQDITLTSNYLKYALSHECTIDGQQNLDCALGYYFCNSGTGSCVETVAPIVIQIAKALSTP